MTTLQFDRNRKRVRRCPCDKSNKDGKFIPYVGFADKGYCHSCGKTFLPDRVEDNPLLPLYQGDAVRRYNKWREPLPVYGGGAPVVRAEAIAPQRSTFPHDLAMKTMKNYERNRFVVWLRGLFGGTRASQLCEMYKIGTSKHWDGATVFWYFDGEGECRSGKIMLYDDCGHRVKQPFSHCAWAHTAAKLADFELSQCFFGEHLLRDSQAPVAIVESEKTAIVASVYFPEYTWIACGGANGLTTSKCAALEGRTVQLYPDIGKFDLWSEKAVGLEGICRAVKVSDFIEKNSVEGEGDFDMADCLVRYPVSAPAPPIAELSPVIDWGNDELFSVYRITDGEEFVDFEWEEYRTAVPQVDAEAILSEIDEIERQLEGVEFPKGTVRINDWSTTDDMAGYVRGSIERARSTVRNYHVGRMCMLRLRGLRERATPSFGHPSVGGEFV